MVHAHKKTHIHTKNTHIHKLAPKPVCEHEDMTVLWNQGVHKDRELWQQARYLIRNEQDKTCKLTCGDTSGQKCHAKGSRKQNKYES
jgi:hypothetical protein